MPFVPLNSNPTLDESEFTVLEDPVSPTPVIDVQLILDVAQLSTVYRPAVSDSSKSTTDLSSSIGISHESFANRSNAFQTHFAKLTDVLDHSKRDIVSALLNLRDYSNIHNTLEETDYDNDQSSCSTCQDLEKEKLTEKHLQIDRLTVLMKILLSLAKNFEELIVKMIAGKVEILGVAEAYSSIKFMHKAMTDALDEATPSKKKEQASFDGSSSTESTFINPVSDQLAELISSISEL